MPTRPLRCEREGKPRKPRQEIDEVIDEPLLDEDPQPFRLDIPGCGLKVHFCVGNRAYGYKWLRNLSDSHPNQFATIEALLRAMLLAEGGDVTQDLVTSHSQQVSDYLKEEALAVVPKGGCVMSDNGDGVRHAKYSRSKNIAILWLRVGDVIYYTFDDHGGVTFHRGIYVLQHIKHGRKPGSIKERTPRKVLQELAQPRLSPRMRQEYEKKFQLRGTLASFKKLKESPAKRRVSHKDLT